MNEEAPQTLAEQLNAFYERHPWHIDSFATPWGAGAWYLCDEWRFAASISAISGQFLVMYPQSRRSIPRAFPISVCHRWPILPVHGQKKKAAVSLLKRLLFGNRKDVFTWKYQSVLSDNLLGQHYLRQQIRQRKCYTVCHHLRNRRLLCQWYRKQQT